MLRPHRALRVAAALSLALVGLTCRERATTGPGLSSTVALTLAPSLQVADGEPTVRMTLARVTVRRLPSRFVSLDTTQAFPATGDLTLELRVPMVAPEELIEVLMRGIAANGDTVYAASATMTIRQGNDPDAPVRLPLSYVGPDTVIATLAIAPRDTSFRSSDLLQMRAVARKLNGDVIPGALVGWTSEDTTKFTVSAAGVVAAKGTFGNVRIIGRTLNGRADTTRVSSIPPVATVAVDLATPGEQIVTRGDTRRFTVTLRGPAGEIITGRPVTWTVDRPAGGTVDGTGLFTALRADSVVTVTATSEGRTGTVVVRIGRKGVARIDVSRAADTIVVTTTKPLSAAAFDSAGAPNADWPIVWTSTEPAIATVTSGAGGLTASVTGVAVGSTTVRAAAGGGTASAGANVAIVVVPVPVRSVVVTPKPGAVFVDDTLDLSAVARDSAGNTLADRAITWTSSDPAVASLTAATGTATRLAARTPGTTRVIATSEGKADTSLVTVSLQPVAAVAITPDGASVVAGQSIELAVAPTDARGRPIAGRAALWTTLDPSVASVTPGTGYTARVGGLAVGVARIVAAVEGKADTTTVTVNFSADSIVVTPRLDTLVALGDTAAHSVTAYLGGAPIAGALLAWSSRAPEVATVDGAGNVVARSNGATWIDVMETNSGLSRRDSVRVVVQQRLASLRLDPDAVLRYVGTQQRIGALAFDRRGNAMPTPAALAWTTKSVGAIARVDSTRTGEAFFTAVAVGLDTVVARDPATAVEGRGAFSVRPLLTRVELRPADTTLTALGDRITVTAIGRDSLDAPMSGIVFAFATSAPTLVRLDSARATEVQAVALANGTATITATADGVSGATTVSVAQAADHIAVTPSSASIPLGGIVALTAQVRDRNDNPMGGFDFTWESDVPEIARVDASTGLVTALGPGIAQITARAGALVSPPVPITVEGLSIRFETDTVMMAPRTRVEVPLRLSVPLQVPLAVEVFSVAGPPLTPPIDGGGARAGRAGGVRAAECGPSQFRECEFDYDPDSGTVGVTERILVFAPGETVKNVELRGNAAGVVRLIVRPYEPATDPCDIDPELCAEAKRAAAFWPQLPALYAPDTLLAGVLDTRLVHLDRAVSVTRGDTTHARVVVSVPSADTTAVVFDVTVDSVARIGRLGVDTTSAAADTVYILPRQLSADVVVYGRGTGTTTVRPIDVAVESPASSGVSSVTVSTQRLTIYSESRAHPGIIVIGAGQSDETSAQVVPSRRSVPLAVSLTSDNTAVAEVGPTLAIDGSGDRAFFRLRGIAAGRARVSASAAGWSGDAVDVLVTTPRLRGEVACCSGTTLTTLTPPQDVILVVTDSLGVPHARTADLAVTVASDNPAVVAVDGAALIPAGQHAGGGAQLRAVGPGTTVVRFSAAGHVADSVIITVADLALTASSQASFADGFDSTNVAVGMFSTDRLHVHAPAPVQKVTAVAVVNPRPDLVTLPDTVYIPAGATSVTLGRITGLGTGTVGVTLRAEGFAETVVTITVTRPRAVVQAEPEIPLGEARTFLFSVFDSTGIYQLLPNSPTLVTLASRDPAVVTGSSTTISFNPADPVDSYEAVVTAVGIGATYVVASGSGFVPDSVPVSVVARSFLGLLADSEAPVTGVGLTRNDVRMVRSLNDPSAVTAALVRVAGPGDAVVAPNPVTIASNAGETVVSVTGTVRGAVTFRIDEQPDGAPRYAAGATTRVQVTPTELRLSQQRDAELVPLHPSLTAGEVTPFFAVALDSARLARGRVDGLLQYTFGRSVQLSIRSSDPSVLLIQSADDGSGSPQQSIVVSVDSGEHASSPTLLLHAVGAGTATLIAEDISAVATPNLFAATSTEITVDVQRLAFRPTHTGSDIPFMSVGMRQRTGTTQELNVCRVGSSTGGVARFDRRVFVTLGTSDTTVALAVRQGGDGTNSVEIPAGQYCASVEVVGQDTTGTVDVTFSAFDDGSGTYLPDTMRVEVGRPGTRVVVAGEGEPLTGADSTRRVYVYPVDHRGTRRIPTESVRLQITSSDPSRLVGADSVVTILASSDSASFALHPKAGAVGTVRIGVRDARASSTDPRARRVAYDSADAPVTLELPRISLSPGTTSALGTDQLRQLIVSAPSSGSVVQFNVTSSNTGVATVPATVSINAGEGPGDGELDVRGVAPGVAEILVSAPGYQSARVTFRAAKGGLAFGNIPPDGAITQVEGSWRGLFLLVADSTGVPVANNDPRVAQEEKFYVTFASTGTASSAVYDIASATPDGFGGFVPLASDAGGTYVTLPPGTGVQDVNIRSKTNGGDRIIFRSASGRLRDSTTPRITVTRVPRPPE